MAMNTYGVRDGGLVLNLDPAMTDELMGKFEEAFHKDNLTLVHLPEFEGTLHSIQTDKGYMDEIAEGDLVYIPLEHDMDYFTAPYDSVLSMYFEMGQKVMGAGLMLPKEFDIEKNLCVITGTYFC